GAAALNAAAAAPGTSSAALATTASEQAALTGGLAATAALLLLTLGLVMRLSAREGLRLAEPVTRPAGEPAPAPVPYRPAARRPRRGYRLLRSDTGARVPDQLLLLPLRQRILEQRLGVRAVHLHRAGREDLTHRFVEDTAENIYSVSKTVTALAVGIAAEEGLLDPEDLLSDHLPAPAGGYGTGIEQVRLRHLLTMTSGSPVLGFLDEQREHPDLTSLLLGTDLIAEPGTRWEYSNGSIFLLSRVIGERTGLT